MTLECGTVAAIVLSCCPLSHAAAQILLLWPEPVLFCCSLSVVLLHPKYCIVAAQVLYCCIPSTVMLQPKCCTVAMQYSFIAKCYCMRNASWCQAHSLTATLKISYVTRMKIGVKRHRYVSTSLFQLKENMVSHMSNKQGNKLCMYKRSTV